MKIGDIVDVRITKVVGYGCWGYADGKVGFSHCTDWSEEKPIPPTAVPVIDQTIKMRVFRVFDRSASPLKDDVSLGGTIAVDFQGSPVTSDESWQRWTNSPKNA